jgi:hypothetical protein
VTYQRRPGRQVERRGDLSGLAFVAFAAAMLIALAAVATLFLSLPPRDEPPIGAASARPTQALPSPTASAAASASPFASAGASEPPTVTLPPSSEPPPSTPAPLPPIAVGVPGDVVVDGSTLGTVTVISTGRYTRFDGVEAPENRRWFAVEVEYVAGDGPLPYAAGDWRAFDTEDRVFEPALVDIQAPLGRGTLEAGESRRRFVVFSVRPGPEVIRLELLGPDGVPVLAFTVS